MNRIEIRALIQERNDWCVSIIVPTNQTSPDCRIDSEILRKAIGHAKNILSSKKPPIEIYNSLVDSLEKLEHAFDPVHAMDGLGLFVSPDVSRMVHFPFPVDQRILVDQSFEVRELYYLEQLSRPYYVLKLTNNEAHLFLLETGALAREITNTYFPMRNDHVYEYARSLFGTSNGYARKGFEKDKSTTNKTQQESFYKEVQTNLGTYIKHSDLIINGAKNIVSNFESSLNQRLKIKGRIIGSFKTNYQLFEHARATYFECKQHEIQTLVDSLDELIGMKKVSYGIHHVWNAVAAGKGDLLLVEKGFRQMGYLLADGSQMSLNVPLTEHTTVPDLVDQVLEAHIDKGGRVVFTEDRQLSKYDQIAITLRY